MNKGSNTLRVVHTIGSVNDEAAGPSYSVRRLAQTTSDLGVDVELYSVGDSCSKGEGSFMSRQFDWSFRNLPLACRLRFSRSMLKSLRMSNADILHNHGLWLMPNVYAGWAASSNGKPLIVSPRGMLAPAALQISAVRKKLFSGAFREAMLKSATIFHATGEQEMLDIRSFGLKQPVAIIPNGVDLPQIRVGKEPGAKQTLLYFGRLHPIKNLELLIRAWQAVEPSYPNWFLSICGPGEPGYVRELKLLVQSMQVDRVDFLDPVYGKAKHALYQNSSVYVLPSKSENFAMTVAEALANGIPVIANKGSPWSQVEPNRCGWWVDHGQDSLVAVLDQALSLPPEELARMGARGRTWMEAAYGWEAISQQMVEVYRWAIEGQRKPECLRMD